MTDYITRDELRAVLEAMMPPEVRNEVTSWDVQDALAALDDQPEPKACAGFRCAEKGCLAGTTFDGEVLRGHDHYVWHRCKCGLRYGLHAPASAERWALARCRHCGHGFTLGEPPICRGAPPTTSVRCVPETDLQPPASAEPQPAADAALPPLRSLVETRRFGGSTEWVSRDDWCDMRAAAVARDEVIEKLRAEVERLKRDYVHMELRAVRGEERTEKATAAERERVVAWLRSEARIAEAGGSAPGRVSGGILNIAADSLERGEA